MGKKITLLALRLLLGGVFVYAGVLKAFSTPDFALEIQHYAILPWPDVRLALAIYLPWLEIIAGLAVLFRRCMDGGLLILTALLLSFTLALGSAWWRGLDLHCGCFGKEDVFAAPRYAAWLARDLALLVVAAVLCRAHWPPWPLVEPEPKRRD